MYSFWYQHLGLNQQLLYHFLAQWLLSSFLVSLRIGRASLFLICYFEFIYFFYKDSLLLFIRVLGIYKFLDLLTFNFYWCLLKCIFVYFFILHKGWNYSFQFSKKRLQNYSRRFIFHASFNFHNARWLICLIFIE